MTRREARDTDKTVLRVRVPEEFWRAVHVAAAEAGLPVGQFLQAALFDLLAEPGRRARLEALAKGVPTIGP